MCQLIGHFKLWWKWLKIQSFFSTGKGFILQSLSLLKTYQPSVSQWLYISDPLQLNSGIARGHFSLTAFPVTHKKMLVTCQCQVSVVGDGLWIMNSRSNADGDRRGNFSITRIMLIFLLFCSRADSKTKHSLWLCMGIKALLRYSQPCSASILCFWIMDNVLLPRP